MKLSSRYSEAMQFMYQLHKDQERKVSGVPYLSHLIRVSGLAMEYGADEDQAIAGLLHDAAEDQGGHETLAQIEQRFGEPVAVIVVGCSDTLESPKPDWQLRKERFIESMREAPESVQLVSACDKLDNARSIVNDLRLSGEKVWQRFTGRRDGSLWYYESLSAVFCDRMPGPLSDELARVVHAMQQLS